MRVLVLDDMESRQSSFKMCLIGTLMDQAYDARTAIKLLDQTAAAKTQYDVVYLDHDLSECHYSDQSGSTKEEETGMAVVDHIITMAVELRPKHCVVHSWNQTRGMEMCYRLRDAGIRVTRWLFQENNLPNLTR